MANKRVREHIVKWQDGQTDPYKDTYKEISKSRSTAESASADAQTSHTTDRFSEQDVDNPLYFPPAIAESPEKHILNEAITQLSPQQQKVWHLCMVMGKTFRDAAAVLNLGFSTIQQHLERAKRHVISYCKVNAYRLEALPA